MDAFGARLFSLFIFIVRLLALTGVAYPVAKSIMADGKTEYCYVTTDSYQTPGGSTVVYHLNAFRPWRGDRHIGRNFQTVDEAKAEADKISCPIK